MIYVRIIKVLGTAEVVVYMVSEKVKGTSTQYRDRRLTELHVDSIETNSINDRS